MFSGVKDEIALKLAKSRTIAGKSWLLFRVVAPRREK